MVRNIRLEDDVYERIESQKRDDETLSETIDRLVGGASLPDLAGTLSETEAAAARDAIEGSRDSDLRATRELYDDS